jgi:hypothetical protein
VLFALLTKWLAVLAGFVSAPVWMHSWARAFSLERGLLLGMLLFVCGLVWSLWLTVDWGRAGFGPLDPLETMRSVIPAATLMAVGMQAAMCSLFAGALQALWRSGRGDA